MTAFTRALYYPTIDITNEKWLKNATLYWDEILTIVPLTLSRPYINKTSSELFDYGVLKPYYVNSQTSIIRHLEQLVDDYFKTSECKDILSSDTDCKFDYAYSEKFSHNLLNKLQNNEFYKDFFSPKELKKMEYSDSYSDNRMLMDSRFVNLYLTLLASEIAEIKRAELLTDSILCKRLADRVTLGRDHNYREIRDNNDYAQGYLADLILKGIDIDENTSLKKIISFKEKHGDELGRFRSKVDELTRNIKMDQSYEAIQQEVHDKYINEVQPAYNTLKESLSDYKIKWAANNFLKIAFYSTSTTSLPLALLGASMPLALLAGAGVSLTASIIQYNIDKKEMLRQNPYSFLLSVKQTFWSASIIVDSELSNNIRI